MYPSEYTIWPFAPEEPPFAAPEAVPPGIAIVYALAVDTSITKQSARTDAEILFILIYALLANFLYVLHFL